MYTVSYLLKPIPQILTEDNVYHNVYHINWNQSHLITFSNILKKHKIQFKKFLLTSSSDSFQDNCFEKTCCNSDTFLRWPDSYFAYNCCLFSNTMLK